MGFFFGWGWEDKGTTTNGVRVVFTSMSVTSNRPKFRSNKGDHSERVGNKGDEHVDGNLKNFY